MFYLKEKLKIFFSFKLIYWSIILNLSLNFYLWYLIYNFVNFSKEFHVLHYNIYFGIDFIDSPQKILMVPVAGMIVWLLNLLIGFIFYIIKKDFLIPIFLVISSLFIHLELIVYLLGIMRMEY